MIVNFDIKDFAAKMNGIVEYAEGFMTTLVDDNGQITDAVAESFVESGYLYIDAMARVHPQQLHHIYEWGGTGDPRLRLFNLTSKEISPTKYIVSTNLLESSKPSPNSDQVFKNKAQIMEDGIAVTIAPKNSKVLAFEIGTEKIFTPNHITIENPGGPDVAGSFASVMQDFQNYFNSTFMTTSILGQQIRKLSKFFKPGTNPNRSSGQTAAKKFLIGLKQI